MLCGEQTHTVTGKSLKNLVLIVLKRNVTKSRKIFQLQLAGEYSNMKWTLVYVNQWGDLAQEEFQSLDNVMSFLENAFAIVGEPFGFRVKYKGKE